MSCLGWSFLWSDKRLNEISSHVSYLVTEQQGFGVEMLVALIAGELDSVFAPPLCQFWELSRRRDGLSLSWENGGGHGRGGRH